MQLNQNLGFVLVVVAVVAGACDHPRPQITKRFEAMIGEKPGVCQANPNTGETPLVTGSVFAVENRPSKMTILSLNGAGQAALVQAIGATDKETTPEKLRSHVGAPLGLPPGTSVAPDLTRFSRTVVVSLAHHPDGPADRISEAGVVLTIDGLGEFVSWDRIVTDFQQVDLGSLTGNQTRTTSISGKISGGISGGPALEATPKIESVRSLKEEFALRRRYVVLTGTLNEEEASLFQQSISGIDLTGNAKFVVQLETERLRNRWMVMVFSYGKDPENPENEREKASLKFETAFYPKCGCGIEAEARLGFVVRKVLRNADTLTEADDAIVYIRGQNCSLKPVTLVSPEEMRFATWQLQTTAGHALSIDRVRLPATVEDPMQIDFHRSSAAYDFFSWLANSQGITAARRQLYLCEPDPNKENYFREICPKLERAQVTDLEVVRIDRNSCSPKECEELKNRRPNASTIVAD